MVVVCGVDEIACITFFYQLRNQSAGEYGNVVGMRLDSGKDFALVRLSGNVPFDKDIISKNLMDGLIGKGRRRTGKTDCAADDRSSS